MMGDSANGLPRIGCDLPLFGGETVPHRTSILGSVALPPSMTSYHEPGPLMVSDEPLTEGKRWPRVPTEWQVGTELFTLL